MTNQEMIEYLKQYKTIDKHIDRLIEEKQRWFDRALKVTPTWSNMPKGSDGENPRELAICKMIDCEQEITQAIDDYIDLGREIKALIDKIISDKLKLIMQYKYLDGKTWEWIAVKMGFDIDGNNVYKLHKVAIDILKTKV